MVPLDNRRAFLLVRHAESTKNIGNRLSGPIDDDLLSREGAGECVGLATDLEGLLRDQFREFSVRVGCSSSPRALETAAIIGRELGVPVVSSELLRSMVVPETGGLSEEQLRHRFPESWRALQLYRHGLRSSYTIEFIDYRLRTFESRVLRGLQEVSGGYGTINIIVAHRSTLTALLMEFARRAGDIPDNYYGYVPLDLLCVSLISETGFVTRLEFVNRQGCELRRGLGPDGWPV